MKSPVWTWKDWVVLIVVGALMCIAVIAIYPGFEAVADLLGADAAPGWIQAFGSLAVIGAGIFVANYQTRLTAAVSRQQAHDGDCRRALIVIEIARSEVNIATHAIEHFSTIEATLLESRFFHEAKVDRFDTQRLGDMLRRIDIESVPSAVLVKKILGMLWSLKQAREQFSIALEDGKFGRIAPGEFTVFHANLVRLQGDMRTFLDEMLSEHEALTTRTF